MDEADAFTGHDDAGPAYCEVYNHAPVLAIRLQNADQVVAQTPELELVQWAHRMERTLEAALTEQQAFKPPCRSQGTCHVFCLNPELSARQQANTLLLSAHKLQQLLPTVSQRQLARLAANTQPFSMITALFGCLLYSPSTRCHHRYKHHTAPSPEVYYSIPS